MRVETRNKIEVLVVITQTDTQTDSQTDTQTDTQTGTQTVSQRGGLCSRCMLAVLTHGAGSR